MTAKVAPLEPAPATTATEASATASAAQSPTQQTTPAAGAPVGSRLPQQLIGRSAEQTARGAPVNTADQARFVQRVAKAFQAAQQRGGELILRLSPPQLGSLRLEVKVQAGVLTARVETETQSAKSVLLDNLPALKERLAEQGIQVERFDVDLMDRQPQGQGDPQRQNPQRHLAPPVAPGMRAVTSEPAATEESTVSARRPTPSGRINITI
jgi:flagellar hook-length control protein FliK